MKKGEKLELFLLGGHDLEMLEIIKILKQKGKKFEDLKKNIDKQKSVGN